MGKQLYFEGSINSPTYDEWDALDLSDRIQITDALFILKKAGMYVPPQCKCHKNYGIKENNND